MLDLLGQTAWMWGFRTQDSRRRRSPLGAFHVLLEEDFYKRKGMSRRDWQKEQKKKGLLKKRGCSAPARRLPCNPRPAAAAAATAPLSWREGGEWGSEGERERGRGRERGRREMSPTAAIATCHTYPSAPTPSYTSASAALTPSTPSTRGRGFLRGWNNPSPPSRWVESWVATTNWGEPPNFPSPPPQASAFPQNMGAAASAAAPVRLGGEVGGFPNWDSPPRERAPIVWGIGRGRPLPHREHQSSPQPGCSSWWY